jgi:hypothetical protein
MTESEAKRRSAATIRARRDDAAKDGLYYRVWLHLCRKGLIGRFGDRAALAEAMHKIRRGAQRNRRRLQSP